MRFKFFLLLTGLALVLGPTVALSQFGGQPGGFPGGGGFPGRGGFPGGGGGFPGGGGRGGSRDPNERWMQYTGGKPSWKRADINPADQKTLRSFDFMAQMLGATNGEITRDQYMTMAAQRSAMRGMAGGPAGATPPAGAPTAGAAAPGQTSPGVAPGGFNSDTFAEMLFRRMDTNGDSLLNYDEMSDSLKAERDRWDTNKDGFIDLNEFKEYLKARMQQPQVAGGPTAPQPWAPAPIQIIEEEEKRPTVYRAGKLPANLPAWFRQYDTDGDGQIGLYEWKAAGQPIAQFEAMDRNGDGFLTVEEVLRTTAVASNGTPGSPGSAATTGGAVAMGAGGFPGGGFPGGGRGNRGMGGFPGGNMGGGFPGGAGFPGGGRGNRGNRGSGDASGGGFPGGGFPGGGFPGGGRGNRGQGDASGGGFPGGGFPGGGFPGGGRGGRGGRGNRGQGGTDTGGFGQ